MWGLEVQAKTNDFLIITQIARASRGSIPPESKTSSLSGGWFTGSISGMSSATN